MDTEHCREKETMNLLFWDTVPFFGHLGAAEQNPQIYIILDNLSKTQSNICNRRESCFCSHLVNAELYFHCMSRFSLISFSPNTSLM